MTATRVAHDAFPLFQFICTRRDRPQCGEAALAGVVTDPERWESDGSVAASGLAPAAACQGGSNFSRRPRSADQEALDLIAAERAQGFPLLLRFDALGGRCDVARLRDSDDRLDRSLRA